MVIGKDIEMPESFGMIIETPGFIPYYSAYRNLKFLASLRSRVGNDEIIRSIELVGLDPASKQHVGKFSLGMRQRLGIAQAIMEEPPLLILDEPLSGLDKSGLREMRDVLLSFADQGKTILIASHNTDDIDILCSDVHEIADCGMVKIR